MPKKAKKSNAKSPAENATTAAKEQKSVQSDGCNCPNGCLVGEPIAANKRPSDAVWIVCDSEDCPLVPYQHKKCYDKWEDLLISARTHHSVKGGKSSSASYVYHLRERLWVARDYDLIVRHCKCGCGRGRLARPVHEEQAIQKQKEQRKAQPRKDSENKGGAQPQASKAKGSSQLRMSATLKQMQINRFAAKLSVTNKFSLEETEKRAPRGASLADCIELSLANAKPAKTGYRPAQQPSRNITDSVMRSGSNSDVTKKCPQENPAELSESEQKDDERDKQLSSESQGSQLVADPPTTMNYAGALSASKKPSGEEARAQQQQPAEDDDDSDCESTGSHNPPSQQGVEFQSVGLVVQLAEPDACGVIECTELDCVVLYSECTVVEGGDGRGAFGFALGDTLAFSAVTIEVEGQPQHLAMTAHLVQRRQLLSVGSDSGCDVDRQTISPVSAVSAESVIDDGQQQQMKKLDEQLKVVPDGGIQPDVKPAARLPGLGRGRGRRATANH